MNRCIVNMAECIIMNIRFQRKQKYDFNIGYNVWFKEALSSDGIIVKNQPPFRDNKINSTIKRS